MESLSPIRFSGLSAVTATRGPNDPQVGDVVTSGDEKYRYVYNTGSSSITVGKCATITAVTGYSVNVATTPGDLIVGVCKHAAIAAGSYGFLVVNGFTAVDCLNAAAIGGELVVGTDGDLELKLSSNTDVMDHKVVGKAMSALASGTNTGPAYISCS